LIIFGGLISVLELFIDNKILFKCVEAPGVFYQQKFLSPDYFK